MTVHSLHHFNIRASEVEVKVLRDFYCDVLGLTPGPRPALRSPGFWLYAQGVAVLHLSIAADCEPSLPDVPDRRSAANHIAFRCSDLEATIKRLQQHHVAHTVSHVAATGEMQIFLSDPSGVGVELNFPRA